MASPKELDLVAHDSAAATRGAPDLTATGSFARAASLAAASAGGGGAAERLPIDADMEGAPASPGATAKASDVHAEGLRHALVEVMAVSSKGDARILLRRRPADDPLAPDTWDVSASAHVLPSDGGDASSAARRALKEAGLPADAPLEPVGGEPEHRRLEFAVGGFVENVVVHSFVARVAEEEGKAAAAAKGAAGGGEGAAAKAKGAKGPEEERVWLAKGDALRMIEDDPAVCSPFLAAGKKVWFA